MRIKGRTRQGGFAAARPNSIFITVLALALFSATTSSSAYDREGAQTAQTEAVTTAVTETAIAPVPATTPTTTTAAAIPTVAAQAPSPVIAKEPSSSSSPSSPSPAETPEVPPPTPPNLIISAGILVDGLQYDMAMPWGNEAFEEYRESYLSSGGRKWLAAVMEKSLPYISYVEERVEYYGLPKELAFLPVIESEYSPQAVSRSGATGLWQFMRNSVSGYGMAITDWVDERRDFMKSTDGALRKLADNFKATGDWNLALAAYNAGLGTISRAVKGSGGGDTDFWDLAACGKLSSSPKSYVPKFLAIASILRYPELHGLPAEWGEKHDWETLETDRQIDLALLAERADIPIAVLRSGNAELRYQIPPPVDSHFVKVPADKVEAAKAVIDDKSSALIRYNIHKVKSGDTLSGIAKRYRTPLSMILQANPGIKADKIRIGQTIMIPILQESGVTKADSGDDPDFSDSYTIRSGDTLWDISIKFGIQPEVLAERNGLTMKSVLRVGQKLKVPALD